MMAGESKYAVLGTETESHSGPVRKRGRQCLTCALVVFSSAYTILLGSLDPTHQSRGDESVRKVVWQSRNRC